MFKGSSVCTVILAFAVLIFASPESSAEMKKLPNGKFVDDGKYFDKDEVPTYNVQKDGAVDWYTYSGFRRYHADCHVCHGPDGLGSTYAPALKDSLKTMDYGQFVSIVSGGVERITASEVSKMPAFGNNPNVYCYMDDLYVYLKARSDGAIPRGRPRKHRCHVDVQICQ